MSTYPEHDKLSAIAEKSQVVGEFIDWLQCKGYTVCEFQEAGTNGEPATIFLSEEELDDKEQFPTWVEVQDARRYGVPNPDYDSWGDRFFPVHRGIEVWCAEFFGIDLRRLDDEKRQMLARLRSVA